jgi:hypothetical protein
MTEFLTAILSIFATIGGWKLWEYFFIFKGKKLDYEKYSLEFMVNELYGGVLAELKKDIMVIKKENTEIRKELDFVKKKVVIYETHLGQTKKGQKIVELANQNQS